MSTVQHGGPAADVLDEDLNAQIEVGCGLLERADTEGALAFLASAVGSATSEGRPHTAAVARISLALAREASGDPAGAAREAEAAAKVFEHYGDACSAARAYSVAAVVSAQAGDLAATMENLPRAMMLVSGTSDSRASAPVLVPALMNVGLALVQLGGYEHAMPYLFRALALAQACGDGNDVANARTNLAFAEERWAARLRRAGRAGEAEARLRRAADHGMAALEGAKHLRTERDVIFLRSDLGRCYAQLGLPEAALEVVQPALGLEERVAHRAPFGQCHLAAGMAYRRLGMPDAAEHHLVAARERLDAFAIGPSLALVLTELAELHRDRGDHEAAFEALRDAHAIELDHACEREDRLVESVMARVHIEVAACEAQRRSDEMADLQRTNAELRALAEGLWVASFEDSLTGLPNRRSLDDRMRLLASQAVLRPLTLSVAIIDIDRFKLVNDRLSHAAGDEALRLMGALLRRHCRASDLVARYGGEEFIVLLERTDEAEAATLAERLRQAVADADWSSVHPDARLTVSIGVAGEPAVTDPGALLHKADRRLLAAKKQGRNVVISS